MAAQCVSSAKAHAASAAPGAKPETSSASTTQEGTPIGKRTAAGAKESMAVNTNTATPRTHEVLMAEVRYGIVFGEMNEVFNGRLYRLLAFLRILCGLLTGIGGAVNLAKQAFAIDTILIITVVVATVAAVAHASILAFKLDERSKAFKKAKEEFHELEGRGWHMQLNSLEKELAKLRAKAPSGGAWLGPLAYNKACLQLGHPDVQMEVRACHRFVADLL